MPINRRVSVPQNTQKHKTMASLTSLLLVSSLFLSSFFCVSEAQSSAPVVHGLSLNFYDSSCPKVDDIVRKRLKKVFNADIGQAAGLLRLHFHDCFVQVTFSKDYTVFGSVSILRAIIGPLVSRLLCVSCFIVFSGN